MLTFTEIVEAAAVLAQRSGDSDYKTKIKVWVRFYHQNLAEIYDYWNELQDIHNFTTVQSQENYPLPNRFDKPFRLYDLTDNKEVRPEVEEVYFDGNISNIADATEGDPDRYRLFSITGSRIAIATTGDTIQVKSSSSSDTGGITVRIRGYTDSAHLIEDSEDVAISTASPTTFVAGTKTFYSITHISKSAETTGYITIANSSDVTLETLAPNERVARHKILKLGKIPNSANSMRMLFKKTVSNLVDDNDYPFVECDRYLTFKSAAASLEQDKEGMQAASFQKQAQEALDSILRNQNDKYGPRYQKKWLNTWMQNYRQR